MAEYNSASDQARADDAGISIANGLLLAGLLPVIPVLSPYLHVFLKSPPLQSERLTNFGIYAVVLIFLTGVLGAYFCHLRRSYVYSARKVIVLRRMLGQSYGATTLILPNWRLEGADNPLSIRLFPGWKVINCYPYYAIAALAASLAAYGFSISSMEIMALTGFPLIRHGVNVSSLFVVTFWLVWFLSSLFFIRRGLFDHHESTLLLFTRLFARVIGLSLQNGMQTVLYGARLARYEALRLKVDLSFAKRYAIYREDRRFYSHRGNDFLAMARAARSRLKGKRAGGGTTISQQLARSLFINDRKKIIRRKIVEILLARWVETLLSKEEIIEIYLCSVRFDRGVLGINNARRYFVPRQKINRINSVVLVERVSSITQKFRREAISLMLEGMIDEGILTKGDAVRVLRLYSSLIKMGKIKEGDDGAPEDIIAEFEYQYPQHK